MIYNMNEFTTLPPDFITIYYSIYPFTYRYFKERYFNEDEGWIRSEQQQLQYYYDFKKGMDKMPHYKFSEEYTMKSVALKREDCINHNQYNKMLEKLKREDLNDYLNTTTCSNS